MPHSRGCLRMAMGTCRRPSLDAPLSCTVATLLVCAFRVSVVSVRLDINVTIPRDKLTIVIGASASGKSSFLQAIMGQMPKLVGCTC